jgi:putative oxidoreductase
MNSFQRYVLAFSRVLIAIIFLLNGLGIISQAMAAKVLIEHGAPASLVPILMLCARTLEVVAGLSLAFGIYPRLAAVALVAFLVPSTFIGHAFWQVAGTGPFTMQLLNFLKNTAMVGGLLFIGATQSQPTLLPHTSRADAREQTGSERASRSPAAVA